MCKPCSVHFQFSSVVPMSSRAETSACANLVQLNFSSVQLFPYVNPLCARSWGHVPIVLEASAGCCESIIHGLESARGCREAIYTLLVLNVDSQRMFKKFDEIILHNKDEE